MGLERPAFQWSLSVCLTFVLSGAAAGKNTLSATVSDTYLLEEVSQKRPCQGPYAGHTSCKTDESSRGHSLSWKTPARVRPYTTLQVVSVDWVFLFRINSVGLEPIFWPHEVTKNRAVLNILKGQQEGFQAIRQTFKKTQKNRWEHSKNMCLTHKLRHIQSIGTHK